jgi:hypothetical protein
MKHSEIKKLIIGSLDADTDTAKFPEKLELEGIVYDFNEDFEEEVFKSIFSEKVLSIRDNEFISNLSLLVSRVAITGIAAIIILLISIFITEGGSFSINSLVGLDNVYNEGLIYLLGGL